MFSYKKTYDRSSAPGELQKSFNESLQSHEPSPPEGRSRKNLVKAHLIYSSSEKLPVITADIKTTLESCSRASSRPGTPLFGAHRSLSRKNSERFLSSASRPSSTLSTRPGTGFINLHQSQLSLLAPEPVTGESTFLIKEETDTSLSNLPSLGVSIPLLPEISEEDNTNTQGISTKRNESTKLEAQDSVNENSEFVETCKLKNKEHSELVESGTKPDEELDNRVFININKCLSKSDFSLDDENGCQNQLLDIIVEPLDYCSQSDHISPTKNVNSLKQQLSNEDSVICFSSSEGGISFDESDNGTNRLLDIIFEPIDNENVRSQDIEDNNRTDLIKSIGESLHDFVNLQGDSRLIEELNHFSSEDFTKSESRSFPKKIYPTTIDMQGTTVIYSTSVDQNYPPTAVLDGSPDTFWMSSGLYPQQVVVSMSGMTGVNSIRLRAYNVRTITLEKSVSAKPMEFEEVVKKEIEKVDGSLSNIMLSEQDISATYLRFTVNKGYGHFCSIHDLSMIGSGTRSELPRRKHSEQLYSEDNFPAKRQQENPSILQRSPRIIEMPLSDHTSEYSGLRKASAKYPEIDDASPIKIADFDINDDDQMTNIEDDDDNASTVTQHGGSTMTNPIDDEDSDDGTNF